MSTQSEYTRVSDILQFYQDFSNIPQEVLQLKAELGTEVHNVIDASFEGLYIEPGPKANGYIASFEKWKAQTGVKVLIHEKRFYCDSLKITGQPDAIVQFPNSEAKVLVDFKTTVAESAKFWSLQGCFYHYLCGKNGIDLGPRMIFLRLDKFGNFPKAHEYFFSNQMLNLCMSALNLYRFLKTT